MKKSAHSSKKPSGRRAVASENEATEVITQLRSFVKSGGYRAGDRLPSERELATKLGVGRPALREAIKALGVLDVLESRRGAGTFLKSTQALDGAWPERVELRPATYSLLELLEVRKMFEPRAAWFAAARGTQKELREIQDARKALEEHDDDWRQVVTYDFELHSAIVRAARNRILEQINDMLAPIMIKSRQTTSRSMSNRNKMHSDHERIIDAIFRGHSDEAENAMMEHLQTVGLDLITELTI